MKGEYTSVHVKVFIFDVFGVLCGLDDGKVNPEIFRVIERLRTKYKVAVLSNSDAVLVRSRFEKQNFSLGKYFDYIFISSETGFLKPDPEAFIHCLCSMKVKPEESMFIDDSSDNIHGAESVGMLTYHFKEQKLFEDWVLENKF